MRLTTRFLSSAVALAVALPAVATGQTTNVTFVGGWQALLGGNAIGPLKMQLTGLTSTFDIFCIDRDNGVSSGTVYNARILTFSEAVSTTLSYNGTTNFGALQRALGSSGYASVTSNTTTTLSDPNTDYFKRLQASASMSDQYGPAPTQSWDELQYAVWSLFSTSIGQKPDNIPTPPGTLFATALANASSTTDAWANYRIIVDANAWSQGYKGSFNQTFITKTSTVPEPGTYALVGAGLVGLWAASRRRHRKGAVA